MRWILLFCLSLILCSNECNVPYRTNMICVGGRTNCLSIVLSDSLLLKVQGAGVNWWYGNKIDWIVYYSASNEHSQRRTLLNYDSFLIVSSEGLQVPVAHHAFDNHYRPVVKRFLAPHAKLDSLFSFRTEQRFTGKEAKELLKKQSFFLVALNGRRDTICSMRASDHRLH